MDNFCEYTWIDESDPSVGYQGGYVETSCNREVDPAENWENWTYCPYCGKEIWRVD